MRRDTVLALGTACIVEEVIRDRSIVGLLFFGGLGALFAGLHHDDYGECD